jgi:Kef-type K+ transport system membrane component KefB
LDSTIVSLGAILLAILIAPFISERLRIPTIVIEVLIGVILGKSILGIVRVAHMEFISYFGLTYLLFLSGLEANIYDIKGNYGRAIGIALPSIFIPFATGVYLSQIFDINPILLGAIFSMTSLGEVNVCVRGIRCDIGFRNALLGSAVIVEVVSLMLLSVGLEMAVGSGTEAIATMALFTSLFALPLLLRRWRPALPLVEWARDRSHLQLEVRICFAIMAFMAILSESMNVHFTLGAYLAGLVISEFTESGGELERKLMGFGHGFFIPFFFVSMGCSMELSRLYGAPWALWALLLVIAIGLLSKVLGVWIASNLLGFGPKEGLAMGLLHSGRMSLALAGTELGRAMGIISDPLYSALVLFSLASIIIGPSAGSALLRGIWGPSPGRAQAHQTISVKRQLG